MRIAFPARGLARSLARQALCGAALVVLGAALAPACGDPEQTCSTDLDCEVFSDPCNVKTCEGGLCADHFTASGTIYAPPLDCTSAVCDGKGNVVDQPFPKGTRNPDQFGAPECAESVCDGDDTPSIELLPAGSFSDDPFGEVGDCKNLKCDGQGHGTVADDPNDGPPDEYECTVDTCEPKGASGHVPKAAGTLCASGLGKCDGGVHCRVCQGPNDACAEDSGKPNNTETEARDVSDEQVPARCGLVTPTMPDWFRFTPSTNFLFAQTSVSLRASAHSPNTDVEVCQFPKCPTGVPKVHCATGDVPGTSEGGLSGCCSSEVSHLTYECPTGDLSESIVLVRVRQTGEAACAQYDLFYAY